MTGKPGIAVFFGAIALGPAAALIWPDIVKWVLVVGYEVVLVVVGIAGGVLNDLKKRWQERAVEHLDEALNRRFTRFDRRYREYILSDLRTLDVKGLQTNGFYTPDLDDVFVDVCLDYRAPHQVPAGLLGEMPATELARHSIWDFLNQKDPAVLAVLGAPGSGKTTLLRYSARRVFSHKRRSIPILLYLRDHVAEIAKDKDVSVATLTTKALGELGKTAPAGWFSQKLTDGECVVLLDGLDEVARKEDRQLVADWVEGQIKHHPKNDFVITSRPHGYLATPVTGATVLRVQSFTEEQVRAFVQGWYLAVERHTKNGTADAAQRRAEAEAEDLLGRLYDSPALADLTVNPLLLTMIANVHKYRGALPGSRAELYSEICQVMLWRRQEAKKLPTDLSGDKKETLLAGLAYTMMQDRIRDLPGDRLHEEIKSALRRVSRKITAPDFVSHVTSNGLLVERETGLYSFAHHTFQEYLAASHIRDKGLVWTLADNVDDLWWRETTLLYTARADADAIVESCLGSGSVPALSLALDCADQDSELAPELAEQLEKLVTDALASTAEPEHRGLAARVLVTRHLRSMTRTNGHGRVCTVPITAKIYHLFRQEVPGPLPDGPQTFVPDDTPVTGVRGSDALSFARWINAISPTPHDYRLPTAAELEDPAVRRLISSVQAGWLQPERARCELWTQSTQHPHLITAEDQINQITGDLKRCSRSLSKFALLYGVVISRNIQQPDAHLLTDALIERMSTTYDYDLDSALDRSFIHASNSHLDDSDEVEFAQILAVVRSIEELRARKTVDPERLARIITQIATISPLNDGARDLDRLLAGRLDLCDIARNLASTPQSAMPRDVLMPILGPAMSKVLAELTRLKRERWPQLGSYLTTLFTGGPTETVLDLDGLASVAQEACSAVNVPTDPWARDVAINFGTAVVPVFTRQQQISAKQASALRITALCLADRVKTADFTTTADLFIQCAAGITLIERRANGSAPTDETILIATT